MAKYYSVDSEGRVTSVFDPSAAQIGRSPTAGAVDGEAWSYNHLISEVPGVADILTHHALQKLVEAGTLPKEAPQQIMNNLAISRAQGQRLQALAGIAELKDDSFLSNVRRARINVRRRFGPRQI